MRRHAGDMTKKQPIRVYQDKLKVGIWDRCEWYLRLYDDLAVVRTPYVKWVDNSGSLAFEVRQIKPGNTLKKLLNLWEQEKAGVTEDDDECEIDYDVKARIIVTEGLMYG